MKTVHRAEMPFFTLMPNGATSTLHHIPAVHIDRSRRRPQTDLTLFWQACRGFEQLHGQRAANDFRTT